MVPSMSPEALDDSAQAPPPSGLPSELLAGLLGVAIATGCLIPPIVHFVSGPLGPAIGGFLAGQRVRPGPRSVVVVATVIGLGMGVAAGAGVFLLGAFSAPASPMEGGTGGGRLESLRSGSMPLVVAGGAGTYGLLLGALGAGLGAAFQSRASGQS
jgi:hypothetical protein